MTTATVGPASVTVVGPGATPSNGVKPSTPQTPAQPAVPPAAAAPSELEVARAKVKEVEAHNARVKRDLIVERQQRAREREAEKKTYGEKLKLGDEYTKLKSLAEVDTQTAAKMLWGDKWYDKLIEAKINGGAPTGEAVAHKLADLEAKFDQRLADRDAQLKAAQEQAAQKANESTRGGIANDAVLFYDAKLEEYPVFKTLGTNRSVAGMLLQRIEANKPMLAKYRTALEHDDADARVEILDWAAKVLEGDALRLSESLAGVDKYKPRFAERLQPQKQSGSVVKPSQQSSSAQSSMSQSGRSLSNDMTAATPASRTAPLTDREREERSIAAYNAVKAARTQR